MSLDKHSEIRISEHKDEKFTSGAAQVVPPAL